MNFLNTLKFITSHPLNSDRKLAAIGDWLQWQVACRIMPGPLVINYVNDARLLVAKSMTGATGNIYCGLHEFSDMAFLLHYLRPGEHFADIGANVGTYTVLASAVVGASTVSVEPIPATFTSLLDNINLNGIREMVKAENIALGSEESTLTMTCDQDTVNHAVSDAEVNSMTVEVPVRRLDDLFQQAVPSLIKIDVEGFETKVIAGAHKILASSTCQAVIMEMNGSGNRYGFSEYELCETMFNYGFQPYTYEPFSRTLIELRIGNVATANVIYLKSAEKVLDKLKLASCFVVKERYI